MNKTSGAIALLIAAHGVGRADTPEQLPAQVVEGDRVKELSSPKFTAAVSDVPQTIAVIPPEVYQAQGATTLSDVLKNTPGITFFAGEGGSANKTGGDSFYLRGFDTSNSIFVDGVRDEGALVHDTFNLEQVEVFKGPSADNGRGGTAGYINLETKVPDSAPFQTALFSHTTSEKGSRNSDRVALDLNQPVSGLPVAGTALRINLVDQQGGVPGRHLAENNRWGVAPSLALGLGTPTRAFVSYQHLYEHNLPDYGLPSTAVAGYAPPATPSVPSAYSPGVNLANYYGFANFDFEQVTNDTITARVEHDFGPKLKLNNQTRFDTTDRKVEATSPSGSVTAAAPGQVSLQHGIAQTKNEILSNQTNLTAKLDTGAVSHAFSSGLELSRETADNPTWATVPLGAANPAYLESIYSPVNFPGSLLNYAPHSTGTATHTRINTEALYAFDTAKLSEHWQVVGGVRLERYNINELSVTAASPAVAATPAAAASATTLATAATAAVAAVPASSAILAAGKTSASGKAGLVYKPVEAGTLYLSYGTSVRPPGTSGSTNTLSATASSADNPLLAPEKASNYEAGVKWNFCDNALLANLAVFRSVNAHVPAADPITGLVDQTSDQTVEGIEWGLSGKITDRWLVFGGYSILHPTVSNEISTNAQGLTLPLLPKQSGNLWTSYALPHGFSVGAGAQYVGNTARLQATSAPTSTTFANQVPSYWLFSGTVSYTVNKHLTFRLNVANLADREYVASLNNNGFRFNLGAPRSYLFTAEIKL